MTKDQARQLQERFRKVAEQFAKEENLSLKGVGLSYSTANFTFKVELQVNDIQVLSDQFAKNASLFRLNPNIQNKTFTYNGDTFKIIDILASRRKFPVLAINLNTNKSSLFTIALIHKVMPDSKAY